VPAVTTTRTTRLEPPSALRAVALVVEGHVTWYRRNWRASVVASVVQPLLALVAFGIFFGRLADRGSGLDQITGGAPYLVYLTPALLCAAALQTGATESSFPVYAGFEWQKTYEAITATPVSPAQLALGHLSWVTTRMLGGGVVYIAIAAAFGGVRSAGIVIALLVATLTGLSFAAPVAAIAASLRREGQTFNVMFRFVVVPMGLFAGTYFPIERLPEWAEVVARVTPLWHGTQLARGATLGTWQLLPSLGHLAYLLLWAAVGVALSCWRFDKRLAR
jgi:lipooligosaccharide transport system permease protein